MTKSVHQVSMMVLFLVGIPKLRERRQVERALRRTLNERATERAFHLIP